MKRIAAVLLVSLLAVSLLGCGGGKKEEGEAANLSLLAESAAAMAEVESFRMKGVIEVDAGAAMPGGQGQVIDMEVAAEVQNVDGDMRQRLTVSIGDFVTEAFIVGGVYYQDVPGQGWMKMSSGAYMSRNMGLGLADPEQMDLMVLLAEDAEVVEEDDKTVALSFRLGQEFMQAAMDLYRRQMEENGDQAAAEMEWLDMAEENMADFQADMTIWIGKEDRLIRRIETTYAMGGLSPMGEVSSSMLVDLFDFGADIVIALPEEAAQAQEFELSQ